MHGPRAMTSLRAHVILLRRSPISGDSQLSRMGREGRSNLADSGSHSPERRRGKEEERRGEEEERRGGRRIQDWTVPQMGQIFTQNRKKPKKKLGTVQNGNRLLAP